MNKFDPLDLVSPYRYGANGPPFALFAQMRGEAPVHYCEPEGFAPFWAITSHEDIVSVSRNPKVFSNQGRLILNPLPERNPQGVVRSIANMDPPDHRVYRKIASSWFVPRNLVRIEEGVREQAREILDGMVGGNTTSIEFVEEIATLLPLRMICKLLGIPACDEPWIRRVTDEIFASDDPDLKRSDKEKGSVYGEVFRYISAVLDERRREPKEDFLTVIANGQVNGKPIGNMESFSYVLIMITAGHDTTRNALSGGIGALVSHADQYRRLRENRSLIPSAVEEILRFSSPVNHFMRTAVCDTEIRGTPIAKGESLALFYSSANRDEKVFNEPDRFLIDRDPNPHLAFGIGEHFCLGSALARMEIRVFLEELLPRFSSIELAGERRGVHSNFVSGLKRLPVELRPDANSVKAL